MNSVKQEVAPGILIKRAIVAAKAAEQSALGDTRTSATDCTYQIASAVQALESGATWLRELEAEERTDEKRKPEPVVKAAPVECAICDEIIKVDEVSICSGCNRPICPGCMGDDEVCAPLVRGFLCRCGKPSGMSLSSGLFFRSGWLCNTGAANAPIAARCARAFRRRIDCYPNGAGGINTP
jgi:hypothetical protein